MGPAIPGNDMDAPQDHLGGGILDGVGGWVPGFEGRGPAGRPVRAACGAGEARAEEGEGEQ